MLDEKMLIGWFHLVGNTATFVTQWQCEKRRQLGQKNQRAVYVAKHNVPADMTEGFYIFQEAESLYIRDNWKFAVCAVRIVAPVPWPEDNKVSLVQFRRTKNWNIITEWGIETTASHRHIKYVVGGNEAQRVSTGGLDWLATPDRIIFVSPDEHFIVIQIKLLQLQNNPAELPFAVM